LPKHPEKTAKCERAGGEVENPQSSLNEINERPPSDTRLQREKLQIAFQFAMVCIRENDVDGPKMVQSDENFGNPF
jgi:hypothetical protein